MRDHRTSIEAVIIWAATSYPNLFNAGTCEREDRRTVPSKEFCGQVGLGEQVVDCLAVGAKSAANVSSMAKVADADGEASLNAAIAP